MLATRADTGGGILGTLFELEANFRTGGDPPTELSSRPRNGGEPALSAITYVYLPIHIPIHIHMYLNSGSRSGQRARALSNHSSVRSLGVTSKVNIPYTATNSSCPPGGVRGRANVAFFKLFQVLHRLEAIM